MIDLEWRVIHKTIYKPYADTFPRIVCSWLWISITFTDYGNVLLITIGSSEKKEENGDRYDDSNDESDHCNDAKGNDDDDAESDHDDEMKWSQWWSWQ